MSSSGLTEGLVQQFPLVARGWRHLADEALAELRVSSSAGWCLVHLARLGPDVRQADLAVRDALPMIAVELPDPGQR